MKNKVELLEAAHSSPVAARLLSGEAGRMAGLTADQVADLEPLSAPIEHAELQKAQRNIDQLVKYKGLFEQAHSANAMKYQASVNDSKVLDVLAD